jgi:hypothetical protein
MEKWEATKKYLKSFKNEGKGYINSAMESNPQSVTYKQKKNDKGGVIRFWEWSFTHNGYPCFLQYQVSETGDKYRIIAFNNKDKTAYVRDPQREELGDI